MRITIATTSDAEHREIEVSIESSDRLLLGITAALDMPAALELHGLLGAALRENGVLDDAEDEADAG